MVQIRPQFFRYRGHRQTHQHTYTKTNAGENIFPRFRGDNKRAIVFHYYWSPHIVYGGTVLFCTLASVVVCRRS